MLQLGAAIIGTGFIAPVHAEALRRLGRPIVGVLASNPKKSRAVAAAWNVAKAYATLDELVADPEVHVVHITSPNRLHYEHCRRALEAGKHVICEKPLAVTSQQTAELSVLAEKRRRAAAVCYNIRYYPLCLEARQRVADGQIGEIFHVTGSYVQDWLLYDTDFNWRVLPEEGGPLRAVADIGTHWLDLIRFITGLEIERVCADLQTFWPLRLRPKSTVETFQGKLDRPREAEPVPVTTEDYGSILLRFHGGATGCLTVSQVTAGRKNCLRYELAGSFGALAWNSERPEELWLGRRDEANQLLMRDPALLAPPIRRFASYPGGHAEGFCDSFKQLFRAFYEFVEGGDSQAPPPFPTFADGHQEVVLCEAILRSHQNRRWAEVQAPRFR